ncbi:thermonuclease family protein [Mesorhizobium sp. M0751]|uniref:thermonuclease family protein n=1 Tax=unclassified Mesorhizobium TaxID=325217 RepID=UPI003339A4B4
MDAPESAQECEDAKGWRYQCGAKAAAALEEFLSDSRPAHCEFVCWDRYGRYVGNCARSDGVNIAGWLVENGNSLDWPKYSSAAYAGGDGQGCQAWNLVGIVPDAVGVAG